MADTQERLFADERTPETPVPESQIKREYGQHVANGSIDPAEQTFPQYLMNCMSANGGTLSAYIPNADKLGKYSFMIRETLTETAEIEAESFEEAQDELQRQYHDCKIVLDSNCFAGVEFRPQCSQCESDFDENEDDLREVNGGTPLAMMLCDRCIADMENSGELTRCKCCGNVFTPSRLIVNSANGEQEICPECGEVWCD